MLAKLAENSSMPNIASVLRDEISRLARKEIKVETAHLQKAVTNYRSEIAALKRRISELEKLSKRRLDKPRALPGIYAEGSGNLRFQAQGFAKLRQRLELSAAQMGHLLGVSAPSIYKWESGKGRPRHSKLAAVAAIRNMRKSDVAAKLQELTAEVQ